MGDDPPFDLPLFVRIFLFVVFLSVFKDGLVSFLLIVVVLRLGIVFVGFLDGDEFSEFGKFVFDLL